MLENCINCGEPISSYPCKFCGASPIIDDVCPRFKSGLCVTTKKLCPNKFDYFNCKVIRAEDEQIIKYGDTCT